MFGRSTAYSCRKNGYVEFHHFMKKIDTGEDQKTPAKLFFKSVETYGFCRDTAPQTLAFVNLDCIMAGFSWQLHYMLSKISLNFEG